MAKIQATWECDFCKGLLDPDLPFPTLEYPFSNEELQEMVNDITQQLPSLAHAMLGLVPLPTHHRFHFCKKCVLGFLPMAEEMKALAISIQREEWNIRRRKLERKQLVEGQERRVPEEA